MISEKARKTLVEASIAFSLGAGVFLLVFFLTYRGETPLYITPYSDAAFASAAVLLGFTGLRFATRGGAFDILGYAGYALANSFKPRPSTRKYQTAGDYKEGMQARRKERPAVYWPWLLIGGLYLLTAAVLAIVYAAML